VIAVASAVVVIFVGTVAWTAHTRRATASTAAAFMRAVDAIESHSVAGAQATLENVTDSGRKPYEQLAHLYEADLLAREGSYEEASAAYDSVAASAPADYVRQIALVGKAYSAEMTDDASTAAKAYAEAGRISGPYREQALRGQLRTALSAEDRELAKQALQALLEHHPDADDADELAAKLDALGGGSAG
jgi:hypothetical protein